MRQPDDIVRPAEKPAPPAGPALRVLQITDTHLYADPEGALLGCVTQHTLDQVLAHARRHDWPPHLVAVTGDLVHDGSEEGYRRLAARLSELAVPVHCIPGNHDAPDVMKRVLREYDVHYGGSIVVGGWLVVLLDSTVPGREGGRLSAQELDRLDRTLAASTCAHALVCLHHPPVAVGSRWMDAMGLENASEFFAVLDHHACVRGVVWGHIHQAFDGRRGRVRLLGTPSTCVQFKAGCDSFQMDERPPGYRWLSLNGDGTIVTRCRALDRLPAGIQMDSSGY